jgi:hypothetical protein
VSAITLTCRLRPVSCVPGPALDPGSSGSSIRPGISTRHSNHCLQIARAQLPSMGSPGRPDIRRLRSPSPVISRRIVHTRVAGFPPYPPRSRHPLTSRHVPRSACSSGPRRPGVDQPAPHVRLMEGIGWEQKLQSTNSTGASSFGEAVLAEGSPDTFFHVWSLLANLSKRHRLENSLQAS